MCSIGGFISATPIDRTTAKMLASALLWYGAERGDQSSGVYVNGKTIKRAIAPEAFVESPEFHNAFENPTDLCLTHTRFPTSGGRGDAQAQPFQVNDTVSVHNGMYFQPLALKHTWRLKKSSGVDSELVTRFVAAYGIKRLPDFLEDADGVSAVAVLWQGDVYAMRYGNPLCYVTMELEGNRITIFASTRDILMRAISYVWLVPPGLKPKELGEGCLFKMRPGGPRQLGRSLGAHWKKYGVSLSEHDLKGWDDTDKAWLDAVDEAETIRQELKRTHRESVDGWRKRHRA